MPGMNMNSRQMQAAMRKMGIRQEEIDASRVIIELPDKRLVIEQPQVSKVNMMGQETFQVVGKPHEESYDTAPDINEDDVSTVVEQTGASEEDAKKAIEDAEGDLAEAILKLQED